MASIVKRFCFRIVNDQPFPGFLPRFENPATTSFHHCSNSLVSHILFLVYYRFMVSENNISKYKFQPFKGEGFGYTKD